MNDKIQNQAVKIYEQTRPDPRYVQMVGEAMLSPVQRASLEEIENHLRTVDEVAQEFGFPIDPAKIEFGATREQVVEIAESKAKNYRRRAGVRALQQKYGHDAARRIVKKHSGRTIRD
jgi:hypothetical protein